MAEQLVLNRVRFPRGKQTEFINSVRNRLNKNWMSLSRAFGINIRTLSDWRKEKSTISYGALLRIKDIYGIPVPGKVSILPQFWHLVEAGRKGGKARDELYGNPGTVEGRRKGGLATIRKFSLDPSLAKKSGLRIRKEIRLPKTNLQLAEFVGIVLGDGGLTTYGLRITLNRETDAEYIVFVRKLIQHLFRVSASTIRHDSDKSIDIAVYSRSLTEYLEKIGLLKGNKVRNRVGIPGWIWGNNSFQLACLRGLTDTDGSFYLYEHVCNNKRYCNFAFCFSNRSENLLKGVIRILKSNGFSPVFNKERVYLHRAVDLRRYLKMIGTHNPKHLRKYRDYSSIINL